MDDLAIAAVERSIRASEALRHQLVQAEAEARELADLMENGYSLLDAIGARGASPSELREKASEPLDVYLESRRDLRMVLIEACLASGFSRGQIGDMMGVSRQRITALAKDLQIDEFDDRLVRQASA